MNQIGRRPLRRSVVLALVAGGHVLMIALVANMRAPAPRRATLAADVAPLLWIELPPPPRTQPVDTRTPRDAPANRLRSRPAQTTMTAAIINPLPADTGDEPAAPPVDWHGEAAAVARDHAPRLLREQQRKCEAPGARQLLPECRERTFNPDWKPEPPRAGVDGLLPYVRIGKRCIVGLGFFGCAIGRLPEADGHLLDDADDPARPRSSVPDPRDRP